MGEKIKGKRGGNYYKEELKRIVKCQFYKFNFNLLDLLANVSNNIQNILKFKEIMTILLIFLKIKHPLPLNVFKKTFTVRTDEQ